MFTPTFLTVAVRAVNWSPTVGIVMLAADIMAIAIAKYSVQYPSVGPSLPASNLFGGFSLTSVLGTQVFGHILGAGAVLGLTYLGVL
ncbi:MAG: photosystem I reaction center subunit PsaK [Acaryochloris sp. RU_4_1]|nr:photosystem I reaction center subunit PsaK [Acaryochloris sp. SU_5_25]NJM66739.1 photosystem I reaction center subunit PsaK [Acaryochloris sp. RU_4_1]NJN37520.1 photosystem I reaction center subunit PsaK [Acaryochloridaceae cyanobacterium CSU_3_4]NJR56014.1 photosystem I reaction center subunit PsaK [Acaryochloris sp. CRU_2_0]